MSPIIPGDRTPWRGDPGHIQDVPGPPFEGEVPEDLQGEPLGDASITAEQAAAEEREPHGEPAPVPDPSEVEVPEELAGEIRRAMARYPQKRSAAIPALWAVQRRYGWCTPEGIDQAAAVMGVTPGYLQSVASFYDLFHLEPTAEHQVLVCTNISCWLRGADDLLESFLAAAGEDAQVRGFECLGACDLAPMASIDARYYGPLAEGDAAEALGQLRAGEDVLPEKRLERRGIAGGEASDDERLRDHPLNASNGRRPAGGEG